MIRHPHIAQRAFNTPLLVDPAKAQAFLVGFGARVMGGQIVLPSFDVPSDKAEKAVRVGPRASIIGGDVGRRRRERGDRLYPVIDGVAVIDATGSLVHRGSWIGESSGATSYEGLMAQFDAVADDPSVRGVALEIDTFGGEVAGCFDLADRIREVRARKPVWAFVAENAFSAGYAIASQADRIVLPRTGEVGSIGVLTMHVDYSAQLEEAGLAVTLIHAGAHKVDGNPFEPLAIEVRDELQARVEQLRDLFAATVAAGRGGRLSAARALDTEARCFMGAEAVEMGLADEVSDLRSAFAAFAGKVNGRATAIRFGTSAGASEKETTMSNQAPAATAEAEPVPATEPVTEAEPASEPEPATAFAAAVSAHGGSAARASDMLSVAAATALAEVAAQAAALEVSVDLADAFRRGVSAEDLRASVLASLAARSATTAVSAQHQVKIQAESPIVAAAKKAAAIARK